MTGIRIKQAVAVATGMLLAAGVAAAVLVAGQRIDPVLLWDQYRISRIRPEAELYQEQVLAGMQRVTPEEVYGSYSYSNGREGQVCDLGPDGFYYEATSCTGTTEIAFGRITSVDGTRMRLEILEHVVVERPSPRAGRRQPFRLSSELYSVAWDDERFLVPAELMREFSSLAKAGGWDAMKYADYPDRIEPGESVWKRPVLAGLPSVPAEYRRYLPE